MAGDLAVQRLATERTEGVLSLERGLTMLDALIEAESDAARRAAGVSVAGLASELGIHRTTASRLMRTLVMRGYAAGNSRSRRFRIGPAVPLHLAFADRLGLGELARPFLAQLVEATGECAHAAAVSGSWALVVESVDNGQPLRVVADKAKDLPLHCSSAGKCLLAFGAVAMPTDLPARTERTITNPEILRFHLDEIAARGYAVDDEESDVGVRCISAPVLNAQGEVIGCVGIDGPTVRIVDDRVGALAAAVTATAMELSSTLGGDRAPDSPFDARDDRFP